jgi:DNA (cytosine-5)-methyltransferase 1
MAAQFTYIDLFAGIGGFHAALEGMGGKCVAAVEIDPAAAKIYELNWGIKALGDITELSNDEHVLIPKHDVLVAGFPCQPFSKSGAQRGMDETRGTLYWNILRIIEEHKPAIVLLENVRNLAGPRHTHEWEVIIETLRDEGYRVSKTPAIFSPHLLHPDKGGRPQVRERVFIAATYVGDSADPDLLEAEPVVSNRPTSLWDPSEWNLKTHLPLQKGKKIKGTALSEDEALWIEAWNDFVVNMWEIRNGVKLPGFPIWADAWVHSRDLKIPRGTPVWKSGFLEKNSNFYTENKKYLDQWSKKWGVYTDKFPASRRKLEWQAQDSPTLWSTVMHLRPSGIRAKKPTYLPALVAITQTSIIGSLGRRISTREAARLQGLPEWFDFGDQKDSLTFKQLGNGVNVGAVWHVLKSLAIRDEDILKKSAPKLFKAIMSAPESPDEILSTRKT